MKRVLVVVDMQNDFVTGSLGSEAAQAIEPAVCARIREFDGLVVYTLDSHTDAYLETHEGRRLPVAHCVMETWGWLPTDAVWAALTQRGIADERHLLAKSAFGDLDLPERIRTLLPGQPDEIVLVGLCTDICVMNNAMILRAAFPEADVIVDASCCAGVTKESHNAALNAMGPCQIDVIGR